MYPSHDARQIRLWIGLIVFTAINLGVWFSSGLHQRQDPALVRVIRTSSPEELELTGRLRVSLDRDLFSETQIDQRLDRSPLRLDPPLAGIWRVEATDEVVFEPDAPPPAGRVFRITAAEAHPLFRRFRFDTDTLPELRYRPLEVRSLRLQSVGDMLQGDLEAGSAKLTRTVRLGAEFNQPVLQSDLTDAMTISADGRRLTPVLVGDALGAKHIVEIEVRPGAVVAVEIDGDLTGQDGRLSIGHTLRRTFPIAGTLTDLGATGEIPWRSQGDDRIIRVRFDRSLVTDQRMPDIAVVPDPGDVRFQIEDQAILAIGSFRSGQTYSIRVETPLIAKDHSLLEDPVIRAIEFPRPQPYISISGTDGQIIPGGNFAVDVRHAGVQRVKVEVHRLMDEHLPMMLAGLVRGQRIPRLGERLAERMETIEDRNEGTSVLPLDAFIEREPGIYRVEVTDPDSRWRSDSTTLLVSDLALDLKVTPKEILAWVTSVSTGEPVEGAEVVAWAPNITRFITTTTDASGIAWLPLGGLPCEVVTATMARDVVFARPDRAVGIDDRRLAGAGWPGPLDVVLYAERGVHRPGEMVHLSGIVRGRDGSVPPGTPLEIRWIRPDERVIRTFEVETDDAQGTFQVDVPTDADDATGIWIADCRLPGADDRIARLDCPLMPFLPVRLDVSASFDRLPTRPGEPADVTISAKYLHGAPAAELPATVTARFTPIGYTNDRYPDFRFEVVGTHETKRQKTTAVIGADGSAQVQIDAPSVEGTWQARVTASVREPGGRATSDTVTATVDTASSHVGLRLPDGTVHHPDSPVIVDLLHLLDGSSRTEELPPLRLLSVQHDWVRQTDQSSGWRWTSRERLETVPLNQRSTTLNEDGSVRLDIGRIRDGAYRLTVTFGLDRTTSIDFFVSRWRSEGRMALDRPDIIELVPDAPTARPGDTMSMLVRTPFAGTALVTVESDRILSTRVIDIDGDGARIEIPIPEAVRDTCFVSATLIRSHDPAASSLEAIIARGSTRISIDREMHRLAPQILASDAARPGETMHLSLSVPDASADARVHLWAVEEGALLITAYHAPDPTDRFLRDRRRMVKSFSTMKDLLPDLRRPSTLDRIGGDIGASRREAVPVRLPETKVVWRTFESLDANGNLDLDIEIPDLDGALRVMAVVADADRYGAAEHRIGVVPPLQIVAALPRAAAPGDRMKVPVTIRNNTAFSMGIELAVDADPALFVRLAESDFDLDAGESNVTELDVEVLGVGAAPIVIRALDTANENGSADRIEWSIACRPATSRREETHRFVVMPGRSMPIERDRSLEFLDGRIGVSIDNSPLIDLAPVVEDLIQYPYGCGEQLGSKVLGLLAAIEGVELAGNRDPDAIRHLAARGIASLWMTQRTDGRIPYWSHGDGDDWLTLRTAFIVQRARSLDVAVPEGFERDLVDAVARISTSDKLERSSQALAARVLADAGRPDPALTQRLLIEITSLDLAARAHLAAALGRTGRIDAARLAIDAFVPPAPKAPTMSGWFTSDATEAAIALSVALKWHPDADINPGLYDAILDRREDHGWRTTYEDAAVVQALVAWAQHHPSIGDARGTVDVAGRSISFDGKSVHRQMAVDRDRETTATAERIVSEGDGPMHVVITTSGYPRESMLSEPIREGLEVTRRWLDAVGRPIEPGTPVNAGDVVLVELTYRSIAGRSIPNMALVEVLPGGMEFELPTLVTSASTETQMSAVDHAEFRDDRLLAFDTATTATQRIRYAMRAIVPGSWTVPGTRVEAMYEDAVRSELPPSKVEVTLE